MSRIGTWVKKSADALSSDGMLRSVLKNTGWLTGSSGLILVLVTAQGVLTARLLGVAVWGVLAVAVGYAAVVGRLLSFQMNVFVVKWVTQLKERDPELAPTAFRLALAAEVGTSALAFAVVEGSAAWGAATFAKSPDLAWVFQILALTTLFHAGQETFIGMMQVNRDFRRQGMIQAFGQAASVAGIAAVFVLHAGLFGVVFVLVAVQVLLAVLFWTYGLRAAHEVLGVGWMRTRLAHLGELGREMARFAVMVNISGSLRATMGQGELLVLGFLTTPTQVAYYKLARSICQIAMLPMMPMVDASYPEFSGAASRDEWENFKRLMRRGGKVAALWVVPVSLGLVALSPLAIRLLYGSSFVPAVPALAILLVGVIFDGVFFWTSAALWSMGQAGYETSVWFVASVARIVLAFLFVPKGGYVAMAAVASLVLLTQNLVYARRVNSSIRVRESDARS